MTPDQVAFAVFGMLLGVIGYRIAGLLRSKDNIIAIRRDNTRLENENSQLRQRLADCLKTEQDRIAKEDCQKEHGRNAQEVEILSMLGTENGKTVNQIADVLGIGCELVLSHLVNLGNDGFADSPDYSDDQDWDEGCEPYDSTWYIRQAGRNYLANNGLLQ